MTALPPTIPHLAEASAARFGDAPAILDGGESWSYARLWREVRIAASALIARGIGAGDRVAIWAPNRREWIVAAIAVQAAGCAYAAPSVFCSASCVQAEPAASAARARCPWTRPW